MDFKQFEKWIEQLNKDLKSNKNFFLMNNETRLVDLSPDFYYFTWFNSWGNTGGRRRI